jgi:hypothetical protein
MHHVALLKLWVKLGVKVTAVHRIWSFQQTCWLQEYIDELALKKARSTDPVETTVIKVGMMNSLYGKFCQDKLKQKVLKPFRNADKFAKAAANGADFDIIDVDGCFFGLVAGEKKNGVVLDTPRAVAFSILELSKLVMLEAHYGFFKNAFAGRYRLLMTDTDSLCYEIQSENMLYDFLMSKSLKFDLAEALPEPILREVMRDVCDTEGDLDLAVARTSFTLKDRKGVLGAMKLESKTETIVEYVGLAPKMYSMLMTSSDGEHAHMKGKGVPTHVLESNADHKSFRRMLFEPYSSTVSFSKLQSYKHQIHALTTEKRMLTCINDKVFQVSPLESRPLGHWRNLSPEAAAAAA